MPRPSVEYPNGKTRSFPSVSGALTEAFRSLSGMKPANSCHHVRNRKGKVVLRCWKMIAPDDPFYDGKIQWMAFERLPSGW